MTALSSVHGYGSGVGVTVGTIRSVGVAARFGAWVGGGGDVGAGLSRVHAGSAASRIKAKILAHRLPPDRVFNSRRPSKRGIMLKIEIAS